MPTTYKLLADTTLGSNGTITFSSISQSYQDLVIRIYEGGATSTNDFAPYGTSGNFYGGGFRGDYTGTNSFGPFTSNYCYILSGQPIGGDTGSWAFHEIYIASYSNQSYRKMWHQNGGYMYDGTGTSRYSITFAGYSSSQTGSATNSITIAADGVANLRAGSRATLYGIAK